MTILFLFFYCNSSRTKCANIEYLKGDVPLILKSCSRLYIGQSERVIFFKITLDNLVVQSQRFDMDYKYIMPMEYHLNWAIEILPSKMEIEIHIYLFTSFTQEFKLFKKEKCLINFKLK